MKRFTLALGTAALATGIAGAALAQQHMGPMGMHDPFGNATITRAEAQAKATAMFARMDLNGDGRLDSADRALMIGRRFDAMDANHDGVLSKQEFVDAHQKMMGAGQHGANHGGERMGMGHGHMGDHGKGMKMLGGMDADGDHAITRDEFIAGALKRFDGADANHDGKLTPQERRDGMRQHMREMGGMGTNGMDHDMGDMPPPPAR